MKPTDKELEILQVLWDKGKASVREVHEALHTVESEAPSYTTTLKQMQIMFEKKGFVGREKSGKSHIYFAKEQAATTRKGLLSNLAEKAFGGSASQLVLHALGSQKTSKEDLAEIREFLDKMEK
ncbi:MAG: BlaI/MecI/CopY family transcriptional regulator [Bacteroidia bacterium]